MFSLAIYDTLTPGSLTDGGAVAGTGEISADGSVGPDRRDPAEDRRRPRTTAPSCSWSPPTTATTPRAPTTATCAWPGSTPSTTPSARSRPGRQDHDADLPTCDELSDDLTWRPETRPRDWPSSTSTRSRARPADPALASAVLEIESHVAESGWDQPGRLYALVPTADLVRREPALAAAMGLDDASADGSLTPIEQEQLPPDRFEASLAAIAWGPEVDRLRRRGRAAGAAAGRRRRHPRGPRRGRDVRRGAPGPPGGPDGRGRDACRGDVLCPATALPRRRPVGRRWPGPRARADRAVGCHP